MFHVVNSDDYSLACELSGELNYCLLLSTHCAQHHSFLPFALGSWFDIVYCLRTLGIATPFRNEFVVTQCAQHT